MVPLRLAFLVGLVPLQVVVLPHLSLQGIRPDLGVIAACLIGFGAGELQGLLYVAAFGFLHDVFSAGTGWLNIIGKGLVGLFAGLIARRLTTPTPIALAGTIVSLSLGCSLVFVLWRGGLSDLSDGLMAMRAITLPQAVLDAAIGGLCYWWIVQRQDVDHALQEGMAPFDR